jgi:hypothetical protein
MKITDDQSKKLIAWLEEKWQGEKKCPVCQHTNWTLNSLIYKLIPFDQGVFIAGGPVYPVVPVICNNCGNVMFFNALKTGLIDQPKKESQNAKEGNK